MHETSKRYRLLKAWQVLTDAGYLVESGASELGRLHIFRQFPGASAPTHQATACGQTVTVATPDAIAVPVEGDPLARAGGPIHRWGVIAPAELQAELFRLLDPV